MSVAFGKGRVFWLPMPLEDYLYNIPGVYHKSDREDYCRIYKEIVRFAATDKIAKLQSDSISMTEHILDDKKRMLVLINCSPMVQTADIEFGVNVSSVCRYYGNGDISKNSHNYTVSIEPNQPLVIEVNI